MPEQTLLIKLRLKTIRDHKKRSSHALIRPVLSFIISILLCLLDMDLDSGTREKDSEPLKIGRNPRFQSSLTRTTVIMKRFIIVAVQLLAVRKAPYLSNRKDATVVMDSNHIYHSKEL